MTTTPVAPTKFQTEVLGLPEDVNIFLGGGRGGGKSYLAALAILRHIFFYKENAKVLVVRNQHKANSDFEDLVEKLIRQAFGEKEYVRNRQEHSIRVSNGAMVEFGEINVKSYPKYQGRQFSKLVVDEAGEFTSLTYVDKLQSNLRQPGVPIQTIMISNPGGLQHVTLSKRYVSGRTPWKEFDVNGMPWIYCPSILDENPHLDHESYKNRLRNSAGNDEALVKAWITGDWDSISNAFFSEVLSSSLWFDDDWTPPKGSVFDTGWHTGISIDWGWSAPAVVYFWARPARAGLRGPLGREYPQDSYIIVDELAVSHPNDPNEGLKWPPQMLAEEILSRCAALNVMPKGPCDDARGLEGSTLIDQFKKCGVFCVRPTKDRISGWVKLKAMMMVAAKYDSVERLQGPGIWLSDKCRYAAETLSTLPRNKLRVEDLDSNSADHGADTLRYTVSYDPPIVRVGRGASVW